MIIEEKRQKKSQRGLNTGFSMIHSEEIRI